MKFLLPLVVVAVVCSHSESRIVSKCELRDALDNALTLPEKLGAYKQKILAIVACEVERKSNFDTNLNNVDGDRTTTVNPMNPVTGGGGQPVDETTTTAQPIDMSTNSGSESTAPLRKKRHAQGRFQKQSNSTAIPLRREEMMRNNSDVKSNEDHSGEQSQERKQSKRRGQRSLKHEFKISNSTAIPLTGEMMHQDSQMEEDEDHTARPSEEKQKGKRRGRRSSTHKSKKSKESEESDESDESIESNEFGLNSTESLIEMLNGDDIMFDEDGMILDNGYLEDDEDQSEENHKGKRRGQRSPRRQIKTSKKSEESEESNESNESMSKEKMESVGYYGIFQLSDGYACDSGYQWSRNMCQAFCSDFLDDDITDDVACFVESGYWRHVLSRPSRQCYKEAETYFTECGAAA